MKKKVKPYYFIQVVVFYCFVKLVLFSVWVLIIFILFQHFLKRIYFLIILILVRYLCSFLFGVGIDQKSNFLLWLMVVFIFANLANYLTYYINNFGKVDIFIYNHLNLDLYPPILTVLHKFYHYDLINPHLIISIN